VHACTAVHVGRVFPREQHDLQEMLLSKVSRGDAPAEY
jgi:hypothetical protein